MSASVSSAPAHPAASTRQASAGSPSCLIPDAPAGEASPQAPREKPCDSTSYLLEPCLSDQERSRLNSRQVAVLEHLVQGINITDAARRAQVSRHTIYRWLNLDPVMRCAYNRWKRLCEQSAEARLVALQETALDVLAEELETKRNGKLAAMLLEKMGTLKPVSIDSTTIHAAEKDIELERRELDLKLSRRGKQISHERVFMDKSDWFEEEGERESERIRPVIGQRRQMQRRPPPESAAALR